MKEVKFPRQELLDSLNSIKFALGKPDSLLPILKCFCFDGSRVTAYNDLLGASVPCEFPAAIAVEGKLLLDWLNRVSGNEVIVSSADGENVKFVCGRARTCIPYFDQDKFLHNIPTKGYAHSDAALFRLGAQSVRSCMGDDPAHHFGVTVDFSDKDTVFYAHVGQTASRMYVDITAGSGKCFAVRLPPDFVNRMPAGDGQVVFAEQGVTVVYDDHLQLFCRTKQSGDVDAFVNLFDKVADEVPDEDYVSLPDGFFDAINALDIIASRGDGNIRLKCSGGKLVMRCSDDVSLMGDHTFKDTGLSDFEAIVSSAALLKILPGCDWAYFGEEVILVANNDYTGVCTVG